MEKLALSTLLLTETLPTDVSIDGVAQVSKIITEYGIMAVCCAIFIIMALVMFNVMVKKYVKQDEATNKSILETLQMLKDMKNNNVNIAGSFDKHNMIATQEFKNIETELKTLTDTVSNFSKELLEMRTNVHNAQDNQGDIKRKIENLCDDIVKLTKAVDGLGDKIN